MAEIYKTHFVVEFQHRGRKVSFHRWELEKDTAVESAQHGFQAAYGYWPGDPVFVLTLYKDLTNV